MVVSTFGEIMMRLSTVDNNRINQSKFFEINFAGSESNVAVNLSLWGIKTSFISSLPDNDLGKLAISDLNRYSVKTEFIQKTLESRIGTIYIEKGANYLPSNVIYDRSCSAFAKDVFTVDFYHAALKDSKWLHWSGITPGLGINSIENLNKAIQVALEKGLTISCDLNYRSKLWNYGKFPHEVMPELIKSSNVILGNEEDAQIMLNLKNTPVVDVEKGKISIEHYKQICESIFEKYPACSVIAFSIRESKSADHNDWSAVLATRDSFFTSTKYKIKNIVDRVGAGDSFSAGIIYGLNTFKDDYQKTLEFATAASCLKHSIKGDYCLCNTNEITKLMQGISTGRINR